DGFVGRNGAFEKAVRAIERLDDAGLTVLVKSNVVRCNAEEIHALKALFAARPRIHFMADVLLHGRDDGASTLSERATPEQIVGYFAQEMNAAPQAEIDALARQLDAVPEHSSYETLRPCGAGRTFASIQPNGDVLSCTHLVSKPLGNLRTERFSALWLSSPETRALRALTVARFEECKGCEFRHVCAKCPALSLHESGRLEGHSRQVCDRTKAFWGAVKTRLGRAPLPVLEAPPVVSRHALRVIPAERA
ncbi:MAG: SPASM domain-containing protein, partial [Deltaproteobacteria bacterium]|nr:SPASM domain-containing protein [Deltaproteobacteria bacterium]